MLLGAYQTFLQGQEPRKDNRNRVLSQKEQDYETDNKLCFQPHNGLGLVEVRGIEPLSENIQRNSPTCVADDLKFAVAHAHRPA